MNEQILNDLRKAYNREVNERDRKEVSAWKHRERQRFLSLLRADGKRRLLDVGAGTGAHGKFFQDHNMDVVCTDLSYENVRRCCSKGLTACVMDFLHVGFSEKTFDAVFALNCLLHVPRLDLPRVLESLRYILVTEGFFYWGQYGGFEREGPWPDDHYDPKRFFSLLTDDQMRNISKRYFEVISFDIITLENEGDLHFQSMFLKKIGFGA
jgi:SAM-dependent methyltransferase